ncbi:MAG: hypothetical protein LC127_07495 [Chitinophagales bacterium]|nr:hypothetical protein [Chitinophagales bacterium]
MSCWGPDGACRAGGHALLGGLSGGAAGAVGAGLSSAIAPEIQHALMESGVAPQAAQAITQLIVVGSGSMVAGSAGAAGAANEVTNNFILAAPMIAEGVVLGGVTAARACLSSPACVKALYLGGATLVAKVAAVLTPEELADIPGFGAGEQPDFGPGHTGNNSPENPIPGGGVTVYPSDDLQQPIHTGGDQTSDPNPGGNIIGIPMPNPQIEIIMLAVPPKDKESIDSSLSNVMGGLPFLDEKKGSNLISHYPGGTREDAERVFNNLPLQNIKSVSSEYGEWGRRGNLPDGTMVIVRPSKDGRPTIEIQDTNRPGGTRRVQEIRFGEK